MQAVVLFAVILVLIAAAFAIPNGLVKERAIDDRDTTVVGATVLALGLGGLNFAFALWFLVTGDTGLAPLAFGALPLVAGAVGVWVARRRAIDGLRALALLACASLVGVGVLGYYAPSMAVVIAGITVLLFLMGVIPNPRRIMRSLDPRN